VRFRQERVRDDVRSRRSGGEPEEAERGRTKRGSDSLEIRAEPAYETAHTPTLDPALRCTGGGQQCVIGFS
jgi:hypothetical protein